MVTEAGVKSSPEMLQELFSMFTRLRAAWAHVERTVAPSEPTERLRLSTRPQGQNSQNVSPLLEQFPGAESGGWRA